MDLIPLMLLIESTIDLASTAPVAFDTGECYGRLGQVEARAGHNWAYCQR